MQLNFIKKRSNAYIQPDRPALVDFGPEFRSTPESAEKTLQNGSPGPVQKRMKVSGPALRRSELEILDDGAVCQKGLPKQNEGGPRAPDE